MVTVSSGPLVSTQLSSPQGIIGIMMITAVTVSSSRKAATAPGLAWIHCPKSRLGNDSEALLGADSAHTLGVVKTRLESLPRRAGRPALTSAAGAAAAGLSRSASEVPRVGGPASRANQGRGRSGVPARQASCLSGAANSRSCSREESELTTRERTFGPSYMFSALAMRRRGRPSAPVTI